MKIFIRIYMMCTKVLIIVVDVLTFLYTYIAILWGIVCCLVIPMSRILCQQKAVNQVYLKASCARLIYIYVCKE